MESHENRTFRCDKCTFTTNRQMFLQRHVQAQHDHVTLQCERCGYTTGYSANMAKHKKNCKGEGASHRQEARKPPEKVVQQLPPDISLYGATVPTQQNPVAPPVVAMPQYTLEHAPPAPAPIAVVNMANLPT